MLDVDERARKRATVIRLRSRRKSRRSPRVIATLTAHSRRSWRAGGCTISPPRSLLRHITQPSQLACWPSRPNWDFSAGAGSRTKCRRSSYAVSRKCPGLLSDRRRLRPRAPLTNGRDPPTPENAAHVARLPGISDAACRVLRRRDQGKPAWHLSAPRSPAPEPGSARHPGRRDTGSSSWEERPISALSRRAGRGHPSNSPVSPEGYYAQAQHKLNVRKERE